VALVDFFIATALVEEWRNLREALGTRLIENQVEGKRTWYLGHYPSKRGEYLIASASMAASTAGQSNAAAFTADLLSEWRPSSVILVGIAGSFERSWHQLGDVIIPEQVFGYELGTQDERRGEDRKLSKARTLRPTGHQANFLLIDRAPGLHNNNGMYEDWQKLCVESREAEALQSASGAAKKTISPPKLHFDILASGNDVIHSAAFSRSLRKQIHSDLAGVEMEGKGVFTALHSSDSGAHFLMVRGISDYADKWKKGLDDFGGLYRKYAAANAARFVQLLLATGPQRPLGLRAIANLDFADSPLRAMELGLYIQPGMNVLCFSSLLELRNETPDMEVEFQGSKNGTGVMPRESRFIFHHSEPCSVFVYESPKSELSSPTLDLLASSGPTILARAKSMRMEPKEFGNKLGFAAGPFVYSVTVHDPSRSYGPLMVPAQNGQLKGRLDLVLKPLPPVTTSVDNSASGYADISQQIDAQQDWSEDEKEGVRRLIAALSAVSQIRGSDFRDLESTWAEWLCGLGIPSSIIRGNLSIRTPFMQS
jgi:nucleoside phosphorylase